MPESQDREATAARLLRLLPLLTSRRTWPAAELAGRLGVTTRTIRRDIGRLRGLGYPVHATPGANGGYSLGAGSGLPPLLLDDDSAVAVALGLRTAATDPALRGMMDAAARAAAAIDQVLPARLRRRVEALTATTVPLPATEPSFSPNVLSFLAQAAKDSEQVRFGYRARDSEPGSRHVTPYRLVSTGRRWYLVAFDLGKGEWRSFRLDRIAEPVQGTGVRRRPPDPPDAGRFVSEGTTMGPYPWRVRVLFDAPAERVAAGFPPTVAVVEAVDDQHCVLLTGGNSLDFVLMHLAALDIPFTPLDPPELRSRCLALAAALARAGGAA